MHGAALSLAKSRSQGLLRTVMNVAQRQGGLQILLFSRYLVLARGRIDSLSTVFTFHDHPTSAARSHPLGVFSGRP
jgi:hypothetical protein